MRVIFKPSSFGAASLAQPRLDGCVENWEPYLSYALALFSGLFIGLEREQSQAENKGTPFVIGGVRTFPRFALAAAISASLAPALGPWPFVLALLGTLSFALLGYFKDLTRSEPGLTTEGAFLLSFMLGALSGTS